MSTEFDDVTYQDIKDAYAAISSSIFETRQRKAVTLSRLAKAELYLKFENRQFTASFKERGALNKLLSLSEDEKKNGVIAMSAGNHAQGVAYHAKRLNIPATIIMPENTPTIKVEHTKEHGANVILHGEMLSDAADFAHKMATDKGYIFVHPYDDKLIIAGQGTIAIEMLGALPDLDAIIVPVGGGGLISGIAIAAKAIKPDIKIYGVQSKLYPGMIEKLKGNEPICGGSTIAEGIAVKQAGELTAKIVKKLVDDWLLVDERQLEKAVSMIISIEKTVVEGAGAAALAAVFANLDIFEGKKLGLILSGGNIDQRLLATVLMRDLVSQGRLAKLSITLPDLPGALAKLTAIIAKSDGNIIEIAHQRIFTHVSAKDTSIEVALETRDDQQLSAIIADLENSNYFATLL